MSNPQGSPIRTPSRRFEMRKYNDNPQSPYWMVTDKRGVIHTTNALTHEQAAEIISRLHKIVASTGEGVTYNAAVQVECTVLSVDASVRLCDECGQPADADVRRDRGGCSRDTGVN